MKYIATLDFYGINELQGNFKQGNVYHFVENPTTELLEKVGYIKKYDVAITDASLVKDLKQDYETKELKVKRTRKVKNA